MIGVLLRKEWIETMRSYRIIWLPLLFVLLGIMQPLTSYYLSDLLEQFGGLPDGAMFVIPTPTAEMVFAETLGQYSQIGTFILVLAFMGTLSRERMNGESVWLLIKPVSYTTYLLAKYMTAFTVTTVSFLAGIAVTLVYIIQLFGTLSMSALLFSIFTYWLWLMFVVSVTVTFSALMKSQIVAGGLALGIIFLLQIISSLFHQQVLWLPATLVDLAVQFEHEGSTMPIALTLITMGLLVYGAAQYMKRTDWLV
ncbi:ABC transporter permease subunit [Geomicrobium sp. JCM 19039]|uniref:ABC transporter permease subunit n=1 Tax=Geomicrobium sp. JCM 19039 TaxID=1460636 RepID=UPI00045F4848|nr:ABC transporter permease subunit [Geomicrobium sp. JCM 19039]GAK12626.1 hypothetical protein JCM19039_2418 [Geomicrobium sp. JCM 19039]